MAASRSSTAHALIGTDGCWLALDLAYAALLGIDADPAADPIGRRFVDHLHPDDRTPAAAMLDRTATRRATGSGTYRHLRTDGTVIWVDLHVAALSGAGPGSEANSWIALSCRPLPPRAVSSPVERHWHMARLLVQALDGGKRAFGASLIGNPATEMLLHAYLAEAEGVASDAGDVAQRIGISWPIGHRWLRVLIDQGWVEAETPGPIAPDTSIRLTPRALALIEAIFGALTQALSGVLVDA